MSEAREGLRDLLPALFSLAAGIAVFFLAGLGEGSLPLPARTGLILGWLLIAGGLALVVWAVAYLRWALLGGVEPHSDRLVTEGPFRLVRHPVYLGLALALLGVPVVTRSLSGLAAVLLLFLPAAMYRARLEDQALARKFGPQWQTYAARTRFLLPGRRLSTG